MYTVFELYNRRVPSTSVLGSLPLLCLHCRWCVAQTGINLKLEMDSPQSFLEEEERGRVEKRKRDKVRSYIIMIFYEYVN